MFFEELGGRRTLKTSRFQKTKKMARRAREKKKNNHGDFAAETDGQEADIFAHARKN